jgi:hypothetical protein
MTYITVLHFIMNSLETHFLLAAHCFLAEVWTRPHCTLEFAGEIFGTCRLVGCASSHAFRHESRLILVEQSPSRHSISSDKQVQFHLSKKSTNDSSNGKTNVPH